MNFQKDKKSLYQITTKISLLIQLLCYNIAVKGGKSKNNRLMMLYSAEEQYKKIVEEIDKYYTQTITKTTDKEEIKKLVEFYKKFQKSLYKADETKKKAVGLESKLIITTEINNKLMVKLRSLKPEEQKEIKVAK